MYRLVRFLILALTLGRIKWLMRLTWLWRLIVFAGVTGFMARKLRGVIGMDKTPSTPVDSAWAEALRYTPPPATAGAAAGAAFGSAPSVAPAPAREAAAFSAPHTDEVSESLSEVTGTAADGTIETITIHEVHAEGSTESIVRIEDDAGNVETLVTGAPVEALDLANLGEPIAETADAPIELLVIDEIELDIPDSIAPEMAIGDSADDLAVEELTIETISDVEISDLIETLEAAEPAALEIAAPAPTALVAPEIVAEPTAPKRKRTRKKAAESVEVVEPLETTDEDPDPDAIVDPDWVRGDGTMECPDSHPVKAKASSMIFYGPESGHYGLTFPDVCFASEADAEAAGYRAPRR